MLLPRRITVPVCILQRIFHFLKFNFKAALPIKPIMVHWISNYIMTWLLRLSYADLLTASIKLLISLLAKLSSPNPHCHFTSNQITTWTTCAEKSNKTISWFSWIVLIALLNSHSQLCAGKNIGGSPEQQLTELFRLPGCRVRCRHKASTKVTCWGVKTIRACQDMEMLA